MSAYRLMEKHGLLLERHTGRIRLREQRPGGDDPLECALVLRLPRINLLERRGGARRVRSRLPRPTRCRLGGDNRRHLNEMIRDMMARRPGAL